MMEFMSSMQWRAFHGRERAAFCCFNFPPILFAAKEVARSTAQSHYSLSVAAHCCTQAYRSTFELRPNSYAAQG